MTLKVYKGSEASRQYENDFFKSFASNMAALFDSKGKDGILIGHPTVPGDKYLKPDCVLITADRIVIIDFKNWKEDIEVYLPKSTEFENGIWRTNASSQVKGGTATNPFAQLKRQRDRMTRLLGTDLKDVGGIGACVCFQGDAVKYGEIPGQYEAWFSIANSTSYLDTLWNAINLKTRNPVSPESMRKYFSAPKFEDIVPINLDSYYDAAEANKEKGKALALQRSAAAKEKKARRIIEENTKTGEELKLARQELNIAIKQTKEASAKVEETRRVFDDKKHTLKMAWSEAEKAKARAAEAEAIAGVERERTAQAKIQARGRLLISIFAAIALASIIAFFVWQSIERQKKDIEIKQKAAAQIAADERAGRKCIEVDRIDEYKNDIEQGGLKSVCVAYYVSQVSQNKYYVYMNNKKYPDNTFSTVISTRAIDTDDASKSFLNKSVEVRGDITLYNTSYQVMVSDINQITVK